MALLSVQWKSCLRQRCHVACVLFGENSQIKEKHPPLLIRQFKIIITLGRLILRVIASFFQHAMRHASQSGMLAQIVKCASEFWSIIVVFYFRGSEIHNVQFQLFLIATIMHLSETPLLWYIFQKFYSFFHGGTLLYNDRTLTRYD